MDGYQTYAPGHPLVAITHGFSGICTAGTEIVLRDLSTEKVVNTISDSTRGLLPVQWSPDGTALLFGSWDAATVDVCSGASGAISYGLLPLHGGAAHAVSDVDALRRSWGDASAISLQCPKSQYSSALSMWPQPRLSGSIYLSCGMASEQSAEVKFGDETIGSTGGAAPGSVPMVVVLGVR
jgi:hypothetical protein